MDDHGAVLHDLVAGGRQRGSSGPRVLDEQMELARSACGVGAAAVDIDPRLAESLAGAGHRTGSVGQPNGEIGRHVSSFSRFRRKCLPGQPLPSASVADVFEGLNAEQRRAVEAVRGPVCILAGAGSGKTQMLAERMASGIASGVYAIEHLAAVTFTRKAASELRGRFHLALEARLLGDSAGSRLRDDEKARVHGALGNLERFFAGTIHSFCARLLRERPVESGVSPGFTELDEVQDEELRNRAWRDFITSARAAGAPRGARSAAYCEEATAPVKVSVESRLNAISASTTRSGLILIAALLMAAAETRTGALDGSTRAGVSLITSAGSGTSPSVPEGRTTVKSGGSCAAIW